MSQRVLDKAERKWKPIGFRKYSVLWKCTTDLTKKIGICVWIAHVYTIKIKANFLKSIIKNSAGDEYTYAPVGQNVTGPALLLPEGFFGGNPYIEGSFEFNDYNSILDTKNVGLTEDSSEKADELAGSCAREILTPICWPRQFSSFKGSLKQWMLGEHPWSWKLIHLVPQN